MISTSNFLGTLLFFETGSHVPWAGLELTIAKYDSDLLSPLLLTPKC